MSENKTTLTDAVHDLLRKAIIEQALKPGMRLPEDTVGEQFGVSRTIVRHALVRLEHEGLVETRRNRGAFVAEPSRDEAQHVFEVRRCLENDVIRLLCERMPGSGYDRLEAHVRQEEAVKGKDGPVSIRLAGEFHVLLAELTGNPVLTRYVSEVVLRCSLIMSLYARSHSSDCAVDEHSQIIEAIRAGDAARAIEIMEHHLGAVAGRAALSAQPDSIQSILSHYGKELAQ
ncbi:HTH-type transcriptional regulator LutR [Antarctobacter heliothermus]|uniref:HTH-type transcriptional regulator LutR n=1 Tax=Antarctobacter heliothermus TaxID=74033 RepID=A0A222E8J3_9RHOB|nr:GntR family transcriptional regulator [Antarctobacter heliothermus]ASP22507.1 HTH-type transcriptional regulator LutR [Antarctobacter heliothermus]MBT52707.1 GntR family transcriptional regulator [Mameliella sp.]|tara:strand:- start:308 stop:997 length:690 start_codon:yes stop_codon:yes gene_type:complete